MSHLRSGDKCRRGSAHDKESVEGIEDVFLLYITTFTMLRLEARLAMGGTNSA
jgi:hypothetical protein